MIDPGAPVELFEEIDSTNQEAARRAAAGGYGPLWLRALRQTAGRGRRGREWLSRPGNLFATYLGATNRTPAEIALLGFAAGVALAETIEALAGPGRALLKWPNDLMLDGAKAGGILLESGAAEPGRYWFALGLGVNLAVAPEALEQPTASLADVLGHAVPPELFLQMLVPRLADWAGALERAGFAALREAWLRRAYGLGQPMRAELAGGRRPGRFEGLSPTGELLLLPENTHEPLRIAAGDIYFAMDGL